MSLVNGDMKWFSIAWRSCSSLLHMSGKRVRSWPATVDYQWNINSGFQELWMRESCQPLTKDCHYCFPRQDRRIPFSDSINFILHINAPDAQFLIGMAMAIPDTAWCICKTPLTSSPYINLWILSRGLFLLVHHFHVARSLTLFCLCNATFC
jgi:hypothetical protein